jgi:hypothetical protein
MASWQLELQAPPKDERALELWLQHAAGRILFEDIRAYATERIDPSISPEACSAAHKGINDALYGLMMIIDGVSGVLKNDNQSVEISVAVSLANNKPESVVSKFDLRNGDGMCMGYHDWLEGDYGEWPVAASKG